MKATIGLVLSVMVSAGAARAEDGVWVGEELGVIKRNLVVLERRDDTIVVSDSRGVWLAQTKFTVSGPGGKGGELQYDVDLLTRSASARHGAALPGVRKGTKTLAKWREDGEAGTIRFCMSAPGAKVVRPPRATEVVEGVRCYELGRVTKPTWGRVEAEIAPEPTPECMRECRQANMARAVSPEVIDEDCRKTCTTPR